MDLKSKKTPSLEPSKSSSGVNWGLIVCLVLSVILMILITLCWKGFFTDKKPPNTSPQKPTDLTIQYCLNGICT